MSLNPLDIVQHRPYSGSNEALAGSPPAADQDWTSAEINQLVAWAENVRTELSALENNSGVQIDDASTGSDSVWSAARVIEYLNDQTDALRIGINSANDQAGQALANSETANENAVSAQSTAADAASAASTASSNAADAQTAADTAADSAANAISRLDGRLYSTPITANLTINAEALTGSHDSFVFNTGDGALTATIANDVAVGQELKITRIDDGTGGDLVIDGQTIATPDGQSDTSAVLQFSGYATLKKYATGWQVVDVGGFEV